jgi:hypothetical protein
MFKDAHHWWLATIQNSQAVVAGGWLVGWWELQDYLKSMKV